MNIEEKVWLLVNKIRTWKDWNFAFWQKLGDFIETKMKKSPISPGLVSPDQSIWRKTNCDVTNKNNNVSLNTYMLNLYVCCLLGIIMYNNRKKRIQDFLFLIQTFSEKSSCSTAGLAGSYLWESLYQKQKVLYSICPV